MNFYTTQDLSRIEPREDRPDLIRTPFQRDRDRIIHSEPFRRLQNKTQVLFPGEYDFYRTRLTHTIEVAQLGRTIAHFFNTKHPIITKHNYEINLDLIEAICLGHDIGHPPFGHLGERILNQIMSGPQTSKPTHPFLVKFEPLLKIVKADVTAFNDRGFEANAQNLRIVENLAYSMGQDGRVGFNPTYACWEGIIKYRHSANFLFDEINRGQKPKIKFIYDSTWRSYSEKQQALFNQPRDVYEKFNFRSLENQIMELADDIAYSILDVEDAFKSKFIGLHNIDQIETFVRAFLNSQAAAMPQIDGKSLTDHLHFSFKGKMNIRQFKNRFISLIINNLDVEKVTSYEASISQIESPRFQYKLVFQKPELAIIIDVFKEIVREFVYTSPHIKQLQYSYPRYILEMFEAYFSQPDLLPIETQHYLPENLSEAKLKKYREAGFDVWSKSRIICDHIAGMTDPYFLKQYKKLFEVDHHPLLDL